MTNSDKYLKMTGLSSIADAERWNNHSIVALNLAEKYLHHEDAKYLAQSLYGVAMDLCRNEYETSLFSESTRQVLIRARSDLSGQILERVKPKYTVDDVPF